MVVWLIVVTAVGDTTLAKAGCAAYMAPLADRSHQEKDTANKG